jgi:mannitol-1-/sugar-/sorbitol-6-phosphatase
LGVDDARRRFGARNRVVGRDEPELVARLTLECEAVLFDVDGVLVDSRAVVERSWALWAARRGIDPKGIVQRAHGRRTIETIRALAPQLDADEETAWLESAELQDTGGLVALPGAETALRAVPDSRRALVTSGGRALASMRMRAAGLPVPSVLVAAEDVQIGKPAPDGYLLAARRLGFEAHECVVVEDAPPGITAGRASGAHVIALTTTFPATALTEASVIVPTLDAVQIAAEGRYLRIEVL